MLEARGPGLGAERVHELTVGFPVPVPVGAGECSVSEEFLHAGLEAAFGGARCVRDLGVVTS